jgi:hypothetical protein
MRSLPPVRRPHPPSDPGAAGRDRGTRGALQGERNRARLSNPRDTPDVNVQYHAVNGAQAAD